MASPTNPTPAAVLRTAQQLIWKKSAWTTNAAARDAQGEWATTWAGNAVCWCAIGAIECAARGLGIPLNVEVKAQYFLAKAIRGSVSEYNDTHTHRQVIGRFTRAIAWAEKGEAS